MVDSVVLPLQNIRKQRRSSSYYRARIPCVVVKYKFIFLGEFLSREDAYSKRAKVDIVRVA